MEVAVAIGIPLAGLIIAAASFFGQHRDTKKVLRLEHDLAACRKTVAKLKIRLINQERRFID